MVRKPGACDLSNCDIFTALSDPSNPKSPLFFKFSDLSSYFETGEVTVFIFSTPVDRRKTVLRITTKPKEGVAGSRDPF